MGFSRAAAFVSLALPFLSLTRAQISLSDVPQDSCAGNVATGTATYSTDMTIPTGTQRIPAGDFWDQMGAVWVFSTDTEGVEFSDLGIPGAGSPEADIPSFDLSALQLPPAGSKTAWTLAVPTESGAGEWDIVFVAAPPSNTPPPNPVPSTTPVSPGSSSATATSSTSSVPARFRRHELPGAHLKKRKSDASSVAAPATTGSTFHLMIEGTYPCAANPSLGLQPGPTVTGAPNPTVAAQCSKYSISTNAAAWTAYAANSYMSSILSAAAPASTAPQVNAAPLFAHDIGAQDECT